MSIETDRLNIFPIFVFKRIYNYNETILGLLQLQQDLLLFNISKLEAISIVYRYIK